MSEQTPNVLEEWPPSRLADYQSGFDHGYLLGLERGREIEHDEVAAIQRAAVTSVRAAVTLPPRDRDADRAAAERREARWSK